MNDAVDSLLFNEFQIFFFLHWVPNFFLLQEEIFPND